MANEIDFTKPGTWLPDKYDTEASVARHYERSGYDSTTASRLAKESLAYVNETPYFPSPPSNPPSPENPEDFIANPYDTYNSILRYFTNLGLSETEAKKFADNAYEKATLSGFTPDAGDTFNSIVTAYTNAGYTLEDAQKKAEKRFSWTPTPGDTFNSILNNLIKSGMPPDMAQAKATELFNQSQAIYDENNPPLDSTPSEFEQLLAQLNDIEQQKLDMSSISPIEIQSQPQLNESQLLAIEEDCAPLWHVAKLPIEQQYRIIKALRDRLRATSNAKIKYRRKGVLNNATKRIQGKRRYYPSRRQW